MQQYDLVVIGSGPAGEKAAVKAAYFGYKVAVIEKEEKLGGAGVNTGTLPSKTLKESAIYYSGDRDKGLFGVSKTLRSKTTIEDFMFRKNAVTEKLEKEVRLNLERHGVDLYHGRARFKDKNTIHVMGSIEREISGKYFLIATGTRPFHPSNIPFDWERIHDSDSILSLKRFPESICILGAGVIGCEYSTIFSKMGSRVFLINRTDQILPFIDREITQALIDIMEKHKVKVLFDTSVKEVVRPVKSDEKLAVPLESGETLHVDMFLFSAGRQGATEDLNLGAVGVKANSRGNIEVDKCYRTSTSNIFAVGDVIGFPALASTSMDQGRVAVEHMFKTKDTKKLATVLPYGIYTVPELSMVGLTEEQAKEQGIDCCSGVAYYKDMPRGMIMGIEEGMLKIVFDRKKLHVIGVSVIGDHATEIIHYGMYLVEHKVSVMELINTVFNYPTLHDLYKYAAYDGLGNLSGHKVK